MMRIISPNELIILRHYHNINVIRRFAGGVAYLLRMFRLIQMTSATSGPRGDTEKPVRRSPV